MHLTQSPSPEPFLKSLTHQGPSGGCRTHTLPRTLGKQRSELVLFIETHVTVSLGAESGGCGHVLRAGFLFLNFSTYREHVCSASKNQSLFRKAAVQPQSPTQRFDPGESLHPSTERVNRHGPPCSAQKRPRRTAAPEHWEAPGKGPNTQSTQAASPGSTRAPRDASPGQNPTSSEVSLPTAPTQHNVVP